VRITAWLRGLDPEGLARVCRSRPDVYEPPVSSIEELARRLSSAESVAAAVAGLDRDALQVAQSVVVLGDGVDVDRLRAFVRDPRGVLDTVLSALAERALVWPGERAGTLRCGVALARHWQYPLDLGRPARVLADAMNKETVRTAARRLHLKLGNSRDDAVGIVAAGLADPATVARVVAQTSAEARALLDDLAHRPRLLAASTGCWDPRYGYGSPRPREAAEQLYDLGLLLASSSYGTAELPRETAMVLRGSDWGPELTGPPVIDVTSVRTTGAEMNALAAVEAVAWLLAHVAQTPLPMLKKGGIGVRDLRRLSAAVAAEQDAVVLWLALSDRAGLLGLGVDGFQPTRRYDQWSGDEAHARWSVLAETWQRLGQQRSDPIPPPLPAGVFEQGGVALRPDLLALLAELPEGSASTGDLAAAMAWRLPLADTSPARVAAVLAEAELLGLTVSGALSTLGRGLVQGHAGQVASAVFPAAASTVVLQSDLTAQATGPASAQTVMMLDRLADRVGSGRWRFSRESVRRALDDGQTGDEVGAALESVAATGVPQPLAYLVRDVARTHGQMRVRDCGCCVLADDPLIIEEIVALNLGLLRVAPTVAVGQGSATMILADLRAAGYAPVAENAAEPNGVPVAIHRVAAPDPATTAGGAAGTVLPRIGQTSPDSLAALLHTAPVPLEQRIDALTERLLGTHSALSHTGLPADQVRLLAEAAERGTAVWIEHEKTFTVSGRTSLLLLDELHLEPSGIVAWCHTWQTEETFRPFSIRSVEPA
jgi:hypothetical protein